MTPQLIAGSDGRSITTIMRSTNFSSCGGRKIWFDCVQASQEDALAPVAKDHLRRMLDYQEKIRADQPIAQPPPERQLKMPLIGEVRRPEPAPLKPKRPRTKKLLQPRLED
jgi:hypothetical protein